MKKIRFKLYSSLKRVNDYNKNKKISFLTDKKVKKRNVLFFLSKKYKISKINSLIRNDNKKLFILSLE
ncbi:50S ribosomal subunit protein L23 [Candidatus Vidania fulgoroideae]|nr:50S ribosomal subunit protein L23 [Candidatus Vidania fulgoroideae]